VATFLTYLLGLLVVGGVLFLLASFAFGRGEELAPMPPDGTPVELPDGRFGSDAVRALRLSVVLRGYRMDEVDWVLEALAGQLDERDREIARLRAAIDESGPRIDPVDEAPPIGPAAEPVVDEPAGPAEPAVGTRVEPAAGRRVGAARAGSGPAVADPGEDGGNG
jgi:DivIVA domain-containing protein